LTVSPILFYLFIMGGNVVAEAGAGHEKAPRVVKPAIADPRAPSIPATTFSHAYKSQFLKLITGSEQPADNDLALLELLSHVNCSYLSPPGRPATLLDLKKHAQSLTVLIHNLTLSTSSAVIDGANSDDPQFFAGEAFDWLNDLSTPYENRDRSHNTAITTVANSLVDWHTTVAQKCPLHKVQTSDNPDGLGCVDGLQLPWATSDSLLSHANECLEILDHDCSGNGGILSILPLEADVENYERAKKTVVGQMIVYMQKLVMRVHELELTYANAADVLAGEALVPAQLLSELGAQGRKPRPLVWPQDRFVLANATDDIWHYLDRELTRAEKEAQQKANLHRHAGTASRRLWLDNGGTEYLKGVTFVDIRTRYCRTSGEKTIFVIPAHEHHPNVAETRIAEANPVVVQVVKPEWPEKQSQWETKQRARLAAGAEAERQLRAEQRKSKGLENDILLLKSQLQNSQEWNVRLDSAAKALQRGQSEENPALVLGREFEALQTRQAELIAHQTRQAAEQRTLLEDRAKLDDDISAHAEAVAAFDEQSASIETRLARTDANLAARYAHRPIETQEVVELDVQLKRATYAMNAYQAAVQRLRDRASATDSPLIARTHVKSLLDSADEITTELEREEGVWCREDVGFSRLRT
jgi:hypothetical protein